MSGKVLRIAGLIALGVGVLATAGAFGPLAGGILGIGGLTGGRLLAFGALTTLGALFSPRIPRITGASLASQLQINVSPDAGRTVVLGRTALAGTLRFRFVSQGGTKSDDILWIVLVLSGTPVDAIESATINGTPVTWDPSTGAVTTGTFAGKLWIYTRLGTETTSAFPSLTLDSSDWAAKTRIGRGMAAVAIKAKIDTTFNGKLEPLFTVRGARLYDPRLDTTVGGSGPHRWADPTTWTWSRNAALAKLGYLRGFFINDALGAPVLIQGRGLAAHPEWIDFGSWIAEANLCDELVPVVGGGTIPRYPCDGVLVPGRSHRDQLALLSTADAGAVVWSGGVYRNRAGVARTPSLTPLTEGDLLGVPATVVLAAAQRERLTTVRGQFQDASDGYRPKDYPAVVDAAAVAIVGDRPIELTFPYTSDHRAAQRIAQIVLRRAAAAKQVTLTTTARWLWTQPGDVLTVQLPTYGIASAVMVISSWEASLQPDAAGNLGLVVTMSLVEDPASIYLWTPLTDERSMTTPAALPAVQALPSVKQLPQGGLTAIDGGERSVATIVAGGLVLLSETGQTDGMGNLRLTKGERGGTVMDGGSVVFTPPYQTVPIVEVGGGLGYQGDSSKWSPGFSPTADQFRDIQGQNLTAGGFSVVAKLRQTGVLTPHRHGFTGTVLNVLNETDTVTLANAPSATNQYTVQGDLTITLQANPLETPPPLVTGTITVALDSSDNAGGNWTQRETVVETFATDSGAQETVVIPISRTIVVSGLDPTDQVRWRFVSFVVTGDNVGTPVGQMVGRTGTTTNANAGVHYQTSAGDNTTTMTPSAAFPLLWRAKAVS